jgi:hypothetical protein
MEFYLIEIGGGSFPKKVSLIDWFFWSGRFLKKYQIGRFLKKSQIERSLKKSQKPNFR